MVASALTITPEREEIIDFSDPYFDTGTWQQYGFGFPEGSALRVEVNLALQKIRDDGTYARLYHKWFEARPTSISRPTSVMGLAESYWEYLDQNRITTISARALPDGSATGVVQVVRGTAESTCIIEVRDLAVETREGGDGRWAYLMGVVSSDSGAPASVGRWAYLVVYDGSAVGEVDTVSVLWIADSYPGEDEIQALLDARWIFEEYSWMNPLMPVTSGGFKLLP